MYSVELNDLAKEYPQMNFIHCDKNGFVYLSQYEPRYWGWTEKSGRWMASNLKILYGVKCYLDWRDSVFEIRDYIDKKYYLET